jgi:hypothetical protein
MSSAGNYITKIIFRSQLPREQVVGMMKERLGSFSQLNGLEQKFYTEAGDGGPVSITATELGTWEDWR